MPKLMADTVWGGPTKRFFVSMLTRDIELSDALLDLIDNCIDGATRQSINKARKAKPYDGYWAKLTLSSKSFEISDNCGGIPQSAIKDAFLLGRPVVEKDKGIPTIGVYGIGMKRAIFKIGEEATVESFAADGAFAVTYTKAWLSPKNEEWDLPIKSIRDRAEKGVRISVAALKSDIAKMFGNESFVNELKNSISEHFGYLMQKGFEVYVNGERLKPRTLQLHTAELSRKNGIRPYDFEASEDGVHIRVTVGFFRPLVMSDEIEEAAEGQTETDQAGISVLCNDRIVLVHDKSARTGWGDGAVPKYHPQFRSIAGLIVFTTNEPEKLPISTTKRDLDVGSDVYLQARQYCMEGLREFTEFTNKWKGMEEEATEFFEHSKRKDVRTEVSLAADHGRPIRGRPTAKKLSANLPLPVSRNPRRRISFVRKEDEIRKVSSFLFNEPDEKPALVGQECFDRTLKAARK